MTGLKQLLTAAIFALVVEQAYATSTEQRKRAAANTFDYVIIGGGTGGLTIAKRLSENSNNTVAVIEAGGLYEVGDPLLSSTPAGDVFWCGSSPKDTNNAIDWNFVTTPQTGAADREIHYARGKCLGGSSARNFMIYQRGTVGSYERWADEVGDDSYLWENLQPYFKKSPHFTPPNAALRAPNASAAYNPAAFSPSGGPLSVSYANYAGPFSSYMQLALEEIGLPAAVDFNSGVLNGTQYCASTINPSKGTRSSSQTAFLGNGSSQSNLYVMQNTLAKKILFNGTTAVGVDVVGSLGLPYTVTATKEIILSGGAFHSPQMLMVSGIGPAKVLEPLNISVIADRPGVGQNMWDHVFFGPTYRVNLQTFTRLANDYLYVAEEFVPFATPPHTGPLTNPVCDYLGWEKVPSALQANFSQSSREQLATLPSDWPEIEYLSGPGYIGNFSSLPFTQPKDGYEYATILGAVVAPFSRGTVTISSADTADLPVINPNWLTSETDQQVAVAAFKRARAAFQSSAMQPALVETVEYFPGPQVQTDEEILQTIREIVMTVWHASCTCKMGRENDTMAVVDSHARVYGVNGLRVVDASAFPLLPPGHPQSTIYMLAEKIAAHILAGA